jgi:peptide/nickel transport system permease protein
VNTKSLIAGRLFQSLIVLFVVSLGSFVLMRYTPGDPVSALLGQQTRTMSREDLANVRENLGLNDPFFVQYGHWLDRALHGDLGYSLSLKRPVTELIGERIGATLTLIGVSISISILLGLFLGVLSAVKRNTIVDYTVTTLVSLGNAMPQVWIGLMLIFLFSVHWDWFPAGGMTTLGSKGGSFGDRLEHIILPASTLALTNMVVWARFQRSSMIEALSQDYVRTARAKGLSERYVLFRHVWRNSLIPIVTLLGNSAVALVEGAFIVETIFGWPGLGRLGVDAILKRDYPLVMGVVILSSVVIIAGNLLADLAYGLVNPRLRAR